MREKYAIQMGRTIYVCLSNKMRFPFENWSSFEDFLIEVWDVSYVQKRKNQNISTVGPKIIHTDRMLEHNSYINTDFQHLLEMLLIV